MFPGLWAVLSSLCLHCTLSIGQVLLSLKGLQLLSHMVLLPFEQQCAPPQLSLRTLCMIGPPLGTGMMRTPGSGGIQASPARTIVWVLLLVRVGINEFVDGGVVESEDARQQVLLAPDGCPAAGGHVGRCIRTLDQGAV